MSPSPTKIGRIDTRSVNRQVLNTGNNTHWADLLPLFLDHPDGLAALALLCNAGAKDWPDRAGDPRLYALKAEAVRWACLAAWPSHSWRDDHQGMPIYFVETRLLLDSGPFQLAFHFRPDDTLLTPSVIHLYLPLQVREACRIHRRTHEFISRGMVQTAHDRYTHRHEISRRYRGSRASARIAISVSAPLVRQISRPEMLARSSVVSTICPPFTVTANGPRRLQTPCTLPGW